MGQRPLNLLDFSHKRPPDYIAKISIYEHFLLVDGWCWKMRVQSDAEDLLTEASHSRGNWNNWFSQQFIEKVVKHTGSWGGSQFQQKDSVTDSSGELSGSMLCSG